MREKRKAIIMSPFRFCGALLFVVVIVVVVVRVIVFTRVVL